MTGGKGSGHRECANMYELHENEQYFFDERTLQQLADFVSTFGNPCCLCAPLLGEALVNSQNTADWILSRARPLGAKGSRGSSS